MFSIQLNEKLKYLLESVPYHNTFSRALSADLSHSQCRENSWMAFCSLMNVIIKFNYYLMYK